MKRLFFFISLLLVTTVAFGVDKTFNAPSGNLILDASSSVISNQNVGVGTTVKSWSSTYDAVQLGGGSAWWSHTDGTGSASTFLGQNAYLSATGWKSIVSNEASYFQMKDGAFYFNNDTSVSGADETLTPTSILEITSSGNSILTSTDAGATVGPVIDLYRDSASPNYDDVIGAISFSGEDSTSAKQEYASIEATIEQYTSTSENGQLDFYVTQNGSKLHVLSIDGAESGNFDFQGRSLNNVGGGQIPLSAITGGGRGLKTHVGTFSLEHSSGNTTMTLTGTTWSACTQGCFFVLHGAQGQGRDTHYAEWVSGFFYFNGAGSYGTGAPIRSYSIRDDLNFGCTYSFSLVDVPYTSISSAPQISITSVSTGTQCTSPPYTVFKVDVYKML